MVTMIISISARFLLLFLVHLSSHEFLSLQGREFGPYSTNITTTCWQVERSALLKFKASLKDPSDRLSSWVGYECCAWPGVRCNRQTRHVTKLDLRKPRSGNFSYLPDANDLTGVDLAPLRGKLDPSLLDLKYLNYLDLSLNNFEQTPIPNFIGSFTKLGYLNLSNACFAGLVPPHLGNLSNLRYLDLSIDNVYGVNFQNIWASDLNWISRLSSLKHLNLGGANLSLSSTNWLQAVNMLPSLVELHLRQCDLHDLPTTLPVVNFSSIQVIDLSDNNFNSPLCGWLFNISTLVELDLSIGGINGSLDNVNAWENLCNLQALVLSDNEITGEIVKLVGSLSKYNNNSLEKLDLSFNVLSGQIPPSLGNFKNMRYLELTGNDLSGPLPISIGNLSSLEELHLALNKLKGAIPEAIGQLKELSFLDISYNNWEGVISGIHFLHLKNLKSFDLSSRAEEKSLAFDVGYDWVPPFSLNDITIFNCHMDLKFPAWLQTQKELASIYLVQVGISDFVPDWFWKQNPQLQYLSLNNNKLRGKLPRSLKFASDSIVDLSFNLFEGSIPLFSGVALKLRHNLLSGSIPANFGLNILNLSYLDLSENNLNGSIPSSISKLESLGFLFLEKNQLSGKIPLWKRLKNLAVLDLSQNNLSGHIPSSLCLLPRLSFLKLNHNNLHGKLSSLQNCRKLLELSLAYNKFSGGIPTWIGEKLYRLSILQLRGNMFSGKIPKKLCRLPKLHVIDLGQNNFSGFIPPCLGNLSSMYGVANYYYEVESPYAWDMEFSVKGQTLEFSKIIPLVNLIDLSSNILEGEIPEEIMKLSALGTLNLSQNRLIGNIPEKIGDLELLETLDLSVNHLSGPIPTSMSSMTLLSHLNLSYNDLSGPIPSANQFQTFNDPSIYEGNPELCGAPLPIDCLTHPNDAASKGDARQDSDENGSEMMWFYVGVATGFPVGFWTVCGTLVVKRSWRHAYFRFVEEMKDRICVFIVVKAARLRRRMKGERS